MSSYLVCGLGLFMSACVVLYAAIAVHVSSRFGILPSFPCHCHEVDHCLWADCMPTMLQIRPVHVDNIASEARDFCGASTPAVHRTKAVI
jgi:hypothetical protein